MSEAIFAGVLERRSLERHALSYLVGGHGPALILVHGLGGAARNWVDLVPLLVDRYRLVIPDLPGHGLSGLGPGVATLNDFATAVFQCAAAESVAAPVVVGHSFGGQVATQVAISYPSWVRGLVLAPASGISSSTTTRRYALRVSSRIRPAKRVGRLRGFVARQSALRRLVFGNWASDLETLSDAGAEEFFAGAADATDTRAALRALLASDLRTQLHLVRAPSLVVWGARDAALPVSDAIEYARRLGAPLRVLADTGHLLIGERPQACAELIDEFVDQLPGAGAT